MACSHSHRMCVEELGMKKLVRFPVLYRICNITLPPYFFIKCSLMCSTTNSPAHIAGKIFPTISHNIYHNENFNCVIRNANRMMQTISFQIKAMLRKCIQRLPNESLHSQQCTISLIQQQNELFKSRSSMPLFLNLLMLVIPFGLKKNP